jgi:flagellar biosynthesis protein FlhG
VEKMKRPLIASITSGKGGVGKTFVTVNLAAALAKAGKKVLVVDCDLGLANMDVMLGINPTYTMKDLIFGDVELDKVIVSTKGGFDLIPASSGVREMAQLMFEKIEAIKEMILSFQNYDVILLDTGAGISEVVLQFNLLAAKNILIINRELTCLTDAYAMVKVMFQVFGRDTFSVVVNSTANEKEADKIYSHIDSICKKFLGFSLDYLGWISHDEIVPKSIMKQQIAFLGAPQSLVNANFSRIVRVVSRWKS